MQLRGACSGRRLYGALHGQRARLFVHLSEVSASNGGVRDACGR